MDLSPNPTVIIQERESAQQLATDYYLSEYNPSGSRLRTFGQLASDPKQFAATTLIAKSDASKLFQMKVKSEGVQTVGRTVVTDSDGTITDIIPQRQVLSAQVLGLPRELQALTEWSFSYLDLTYTMESISTLDNPAMHEVTFSFTAET